MIPNDPCSRPGPGQASPGLRLEASHTFPWEFYDAMAKGGWIGIAIPAEYGGGGCGITEASIVLEEVAASGACMNGASSIHLSIFGMHPVVRYGSGELKQRHLPRVATGDLHVAFGVTEPDAGLDTTAIRTRAVRDGDRYRVTGRKVWTSKALESERVLLLTRTTPIEECAKRTDGMTLFVARLRDPAVIIRPIPKLGRNAVASCEVTYDGLYVDAGDRVGEEGRGFGYLLDGLNAERVLVAAEALGTGRAALRRAVAYAKARTVFGRPIGQNQGISFPLDGLTPTLHAGGKHIMLGDGRIDRMMDETLTWSFLDLGVDGLVLAGSIPVSQAIIDIASTIPTVAVGGRGLDLDLPHVDVLANDNHLGGTLAVRHLIEFGHTRIAHISGLPSVAGRLRMQGYQDTMRAAGLGGCVLIETGDMSEEGGYRATVRLLSRPDRPTAIFAANDLTCVGALSAATALGVQVPGELSLVGFDNSVFARLRALWLTSVDGSAYAMGQQAARMLLARIAHPDAPGQTQLLPPRLEVRGSSGPAPS